MYRTVVCERLAADFIFRYFLGQSPALVLIDYRVTGVGLGAYFKCLMTMESGLTEALGAVFHCGARLGNPGSWSEDHLSSNGAVLPSAHIGRFRTFLAKHMPNRVWRVPDSARPCV